MSTEEHEKLSGSEPEAQAARDEARRRAHERAWARAKQRGLLPLRDVKELKGDFWPEDESIDEFLAWIRATRHEHLNTRE